VKYVETWNNFDKQFIGFFNVMDEWSNIINYNTLFDAMYLKNASLMGNLMGLLIKTYKISYFYNYNNKIFIDNYCMSNMISNKKEILLITTSNYIANDLSDSIYKINGTYFALTYDLICSDSCIEINVKSINNINSMKYSIQISDITKFYSEIDVNDIFNDKYKLIIFSNFKYNKLDEIIQKYELNPTMFYNDPFITIPFMTDINNYYLFFVIVTKHQFRITRYQVINNLLVIDDTMISNKYYNSAITNSDYLSDLFLSPITIYNNQYD
jgi:hypothetical protein